MQGQIFFYQLADMESPKKVINNVPVEVTNKRVLRERKDREKVMKRAKSILEDEKKKKTGPKSKKMKIIADEKLFLDKILCDEMLDKFGMSFPGRIFYLFFFLLRVLLFIWERVFLKFSNFFMSYIGNIRLVFFYLA